MKQVTMYKIPHKHITTEAMTTAHYLAAGVSNALLCAMYDVVNFTRLQISEVHAQSMEPLSTLEKENGSKQLKNFAVRLL